jgi:hypothetical protein
MTRTFAIVFICFGSWLFGQVTHVGPGLGQPLAGNPCMGGLGYDDGSYEDAYGFFSGVLDGMMVQRFVPGVTPYQINEVCANLTHTGSDSEWSGTIAVFADTGSGPGVLLAEVPFTASPVGLWPNYLPFTLDISASNVVVNGNFYLGVHWNPTAEENFFVTADQSVTTPLNPGYFQFDGGGWNAITGAFVNYRALGISVAGGIPVDVPALGPWGLLGLVGVLMVGGLFLLRRRRALA